MAVLSAYRLLLMKFDYFDIFAVGWLIFGLFWGRKRGMSQEFLPLVQWIAIVVVAGLYYEPFGVLIHHHTFFTPLWSNVAAYVLIASGVHLIYFTFKQLFGAKLVERNVFGHAEFYLGMAAGATRFACMLLAGMALMNSRIATEAELAKTEKFQKENFSDIRFPTYGGFQQEVLFKSCSGSLVRSHLKSVLIASAPAPTEPQLGTNETKTNNVLKTNQMIAAVPGQLSKK
jgi:uncharacterized membrane protein required for colicin V production